MDSHLQKHPRSTRAAAGLLFATVLFCVSGCATPWPVVGQLEAPPLAENTASAVTLSDSPARVRANSAGDVVPVDAPAAVAGTAQLKDSTTTAAQPQRLAPGASASDPNRPARLESGQVFRRLEAALDGSDSNPSPPPPPLARTIRPFVKSPGSVTGPIEPAGGSDSLIPSPSGTIPRLVIEATSPTTSPSPPASPSSPSRPRDLDPAPAVAAVVQLPDVTDWSGNEAQGSQSLLAATTAHTAAAGGSAAVLTRTAPWWITVIGLVAMVGLIGLSRRFGWPSVSPLD